MLGGGPSVQAPILSPGCVESKSLSGLNDIVGSAVSLTYRSTFYGNRRLHRRSDSLRRVSFLDRSAVRRMSRRLPLPYSPDDCEEPMQPFALMGGGTFESFVQICLELKTNTAKGSDRGGPLNWIGRSCARTPPLASSRMAWSPLVSSCIHDKGSSVDKKNTR